MATTPRDRMNRELRKIEQLAEDGEIDETDAEYLSKLAVAMDDQKVRHEYVNADGEKDILAPRTIERYIQCLRICCEAGLVLTDTTAEEFNDLIAWMHDEEGKSKSTLVGYQAGAQALYRNFDLGVAPEDIEDYTPESSPGLTEADLFDEDDIEGLRDACAETQMPVRNRAFLELLVFTGQRIKALLTIKLEDVDLDGNRGYIYLNEKYANDYGGLKGATDRGLRRPIFGATKYVRDWIEYHPSDRDSDDWIFVPNRSHWKASDDGHWSEPSARRRLRQLKKVSDVDKPVKPHNFRHYTATVLHRDYELDRESIRMLLGHAKGSRTLEETYSHIFEDDHIRKAEEALGYREPEQRAPLTPDICPTCGEHLDEHWTSCPNCQDEFGPGQEIEQAAREVEEKGTDLALRGELSQDQLDGLRALLDAIDDPEDLAASLANLDGS